MRSPRGKQREARLLLIVSALAEADGAQAVDVFALDFLLQHPSLLIPYVRGTEAVLPSHAIPGSAEADSSEEALLRWKRSVGGRMLAPMIGRLIARGLVSRVTKGRLSLTPNGTEAVEKLRASGLAIEGERLPGLAAHLLENRAASRRALIAALEEAS